jgi:hypothetical protein
MPRDAVTLCKRLSGSDMARAASVFVAYAARAMSVEVTHGLRFLATL